MGHGESEGSRGRVVVIALYGSPLRADFLPSATGAGFAALAVTVFGPLARLIA
jgi:hypothetical protein